MPLETTVVRAAPETHSTALLILLVPEGGMPGSLAPVDGATGGALGRLFGAGSFQGKRDETALLYPDGPAKHVLVVGTGKADEAGRTSLRRGAAVAGRQAAGLRVAAATCYAVPEAVAALDPAGVGQVLTEGLCYGAWSYDGYKLPPTEPRILLERIEVLAPDHEKETAAGQRIGAGIAAGQALTRELQFLPSNHCTPSYLAGVAREMAGRLGLKVTVMDRAAIEKEGMGGLLAVSQGGNEDPRFIIFEHPGEGPPVVLVGKGVTFDTGGISIKPAQNMEEMKFDMSGAAAVFGAFEAIGRLKPKVAVVGLVPATENMPSGQAVKPGDVIKSHFGKTVEIINTDAEGRLILMDALSYARRFKPACVLDAATLTGAVVVALGPHAAGILGNDDALVEEARQAGERAGERVWPLPLWEDYRDLLKSEIADLKNTGGRAAGTITAAWFLREFVEGFPWAHLDIAGTAYTDRAHPTMAKGPTGMGARLFAEFVLARAQ